MVIDKELDGLYILGRTKASRTHDVDNDRVKVCSAHSEEKDILLWHRRLALP